MSLFDKLFSVFVNVICCKLSVFSWCANHIYFQADFNIFKYFSKFLEKFGRQVSEEEFLQNGKVYVTPNEIADRLRSHLNLSKKVLSVLNAQRIILKTPWTFKDQIIYQDTHKSKQELLLHNCYIRPRIKQVTKVIYCRGWY